MRVSSVPVTLVRNTTSFAVRWQAGVAHVPRDAQPS
jgi:hypothetical protein